MEQYCFHFIFYKKEMLPVQKRVLSFLLLLALSVVFCASAFSASSMQEGSMYVNTANGRALRFRSSKSTSSDNVLAEIPYGTKVYVLDWDGTWAQVRYNGSIGYVVKKYLTIARPEPYEVVVALRESEKAAQAAAREAARQQAAAKKAEEAAAKAALQELKKQNALLDQSKIKSVEEYDVTVRVGVVDLGVNLYAKPNLTSIVLAEYTDGVRLVVQGQNKDWALVYNGGTDDVGYMLLEDLEPDIVEDEMLDDIA